MKIELSIAADVNNVLYSNQLNNGSNFLKILKIKTFFKQIIMQAQHIISLKSWSPI